METELRKLSEVCQVFEYNPHSLVIREFVRWLLTREDYACMHSWCYAFIEFVSSIIPEKRLKYTQKLVQSLHMVGQS